MTAGELAGRVARLTGADQAGQVRAVGGGSICDAHRLTLRGGRGAPADAEPAAEHTVFAKTLAGAPADFFQAEAEGLARLGDTGAVQVPAVLATDRDLLVLQWVEPGPASAEQAEGLGRDLAALHSVPAASYGTPGSPCYLGPLPLTNPDEPVTDPRQWPAFHAEHRLLPFLRRAVDNGGIAPRDARDVEQLCEHLDAFAGPPQPPATIHGDLWSGNVHWAAHGRARLIDPAAQGGHPETDLAMLELFGCPQLSRILAAYEEVRPVPGRAERVPLQQLQHLLVHAALFGSGYGAQCGAAARATMR